MENTTNKNEIFLDYYRQLEDVLEQHYPKNGTDTSPVYLYERHVRGERGRMVTILREARNFLSHTPKFLDEDVVEVSDEVILYIKELVEELMKPQTAYDCCTKFENLLWAEINSDISGIMKEMIDKGYSHVPILNKDRGLIGVFNESVVFSCWVHGKDRPERISDIVDLTMLDNQLSVGYAFIHHNALVEEARLLFELPEKGKKRNALLFVTKNGKLDEEIIGVMSPRDVM